MGLSTFVPGLWLASLGFFLVNCWILGIVVSDIGKWKAGVSPPSKEETQKDSMSSVSN